MDKQIRAYYTQLLSVEKKEHQDTKRELEKCQRRCQALQRELDNIRNPPSYRGYSQRDMDEGQWADMCLNRSYDK
jgi:flagellar biosynthesis chaperone FliJ